MIGMICANQPARSCLGFYLDIYHCCRHDLEIIFSASGLVDGILLMD